MQKRLWLLIFITVFICELIAVQLKDEMLQLIFKPLLIPSLIFYFGSQVNIFKGMAKWVFIALVFSFAGDVLLMFQPKNELFFLFGLASFLMAHIFYIIFFYKIKVSESIKNKPLLFTVAAAYYAVLISWLFPHLGKMKIPVCVYGFFISIMFMLAMHLLLLKNKQAGSQVFAGALLFVISDSTLAINKFYQPFELAGIAIMLTYGLAQFFIIKGAAGQLISAGINKPA